MIPISIDRERAIQIISYSLVNIPSANLIVGRGKNKTNHFRSLAEYMVDVSLEKNGVYLSTCRNGVILMYHSQAKVNPFKMLYYRLRLIKNCIGYLRLVSILKREEYIQSIRSWKNNYLYVWFFGIDLGMRGKGAAYELKNVLMAESKRLNLPVFLETTLHQNKKVYQRYGFSIYHTWMSKKFKVITWFMKFSPVK